MATKDLIGLPLRIAVSVRSLEQGGVEMKRRAEAERRILLLAGVLAELTRELAALQA